MTPEKVDIVIPYGRAYIPENQNFAIPDDGELLFCLRSIEKHLRNFGEIYLIGTRKPDWIQRVHFLYQEDTPGPNNASRNIYRKLHRFASKPQLGTANFLYMNDDHFLLRDYDASAFPFMFEGTFGSRTPPHAKMTSYRRTMNNTIDQLGPEAPYYDIHCPLLINKEKFLRLQSYDWNVNGGMCIKSLYCNIANVCGVETKDFKIPSAQSEDWLNAMFTGKDFFSTDNNCFGNSMLRKMHDLYPKKSSYER